MKTKQPKLTQAQVDRWVTKWKPILKLADWDIRAIIKPRHDMGEEGRVLVTSPRKIAFIRVREIDAAPDEFGYLTDAEHSVVHELIHCHLDPISPNDRNSLEALIEEQAIDALASALIALDRGTHRR
jgi:hypothetical protein